MNFETNAEFADRLDAEDSLANMRSHFHIPPHDSGETIYLCGNSLGLQPKGAQQLIEEELEDWRRYGVEGHFNARRPWMPYHERFAEPLAELTGAKPLEVVCANTLTVNLHLLMVSFYTPTADRFRLVIEKPAFPSDRYAAESQVLYHGLDPQDALIEIAPRKGESWIRTADITALIEEMGDSTALIMLPGVQYYSGQLFDIEGITALARDKGCKIGWDLAHAIGNVPLSLNDWGPDFAVWCSYKYLNGGPGAVGGYFVHERHASSRELPRFAGWWGHEKKSRFHMGPDFLPTPGAEGWQLSNPPIFSMTPLIASLELFQQAGIGQLRSKSEQMTAYLDFLLQIELEGKLTVFTPAEAASRGCQLSLSLAEDRTKGRQVFEQLSSQGVVADWREPDVIRVAPVPLYNSHRDVWRFVQILKEALE